MQQIAVTGTLCSGKSTLCRFLEECGAVYVSADEIVHRLLTTQTKVQDQVTDLLGPEVLVDGLPCRKKIAAKVFKDEDLLFKLESLLHPLVRDEIKKECYAAEKTGTAAMFVAEVPLLFEVDAGQEYDFSVAVVTDEGLSRKWYKEMTGADDDEFDRRQKRQLSTQNKAEQADYIVINDGDMSKLKVKAKKLYQRLLSHNHSNS